MFFACWCAFFLKKLVVLFFFIFVPWWCTLKKKNLGGGINNVQSILRKFNIYNVQLQNGYL